MGRNTWTKIGDIPGQPTYRDTDIDHGRKYRYRIRAKNLEGISDIMETDDIAAGTLGTFLISSFYVFYKTYLNFFFK